MSRQIYQLKSSWTRLIHRVHHLGATRQYYGNAMANLSETSVYPRHYPSKDEEISSSLDGGQLWSTSNWLKGWAVVSEEGASAQLIFQSKRGDVFHTIDLLPDSSWDCFECLLKLFAKRLKNGERELPEGQRGNVEIREHGLQQALEFFAPSLERPSLVNYTLLTSGGLIRRSHGAGELVCKGSTVTLESEHTKLTLDTRVVDRISVSRKNSKRVGMLYNAQGAPQLIVEAA